MRFDEVLDFRNLERFRGKFREWLGPDTERIKRKHKPRRVDDVGLFVGFYMPDRLTLVGKRPRFDHDMHRKRLDIPRFRATFIRIDIAYIVKSHLTFEGVVNHDLVPTDDSSPQRLASPIHHFDAAVPAKLEVMNVIVTVRIGDEDGVGEQKRADIHFQGENHTTGAPTQESFEKSEIGIDRE